MNIDPAAGAADAKKAAGPVQLVDPKVGQNLCKHILLFLASYFHIHLFYYTDNHI